MGKREKREGVPTMTGQKDGSVKLQVLSKTMCMHSLIPAPMMLFDTEGKEYGVARARQRGDK